ncbi:MULTISPECIES: response regulator [Methanobacterium]|jgi:DNA-binding NtrC family response regulator|uniref:Response regulator n=1 Tax=Methanobacterium veterum TaxID=408577 RepID=A0A9E5A8Q7_9EURY|nr:MULTISPECIES: response regulator [Methanobacterium]MCZ3367169.1 response regulator [Methanobacterium veterum]MCZ3373683.1 response regulator [Methanobacterium veterum]
MTIKIIIVEDESIVAWDLEQRLKLLGHEVVGIAASGADALNLVKNNKVDLILMDIILKGNLNGIETAILIKKDYNIPIIYNSANSDFKTLKEIKKTEPYEYLVKPFDDTRLKKAINNALNY